MATQIQLRRDTASNWTSNNPTLAAGEFGWESDTNKFKIGTGSANWQSLGYASSGDEAGITFVGDDSSGTLVNQNETFKIAGTQNITAAVSGDTLTLTGPDLSTYLTASSSTTLTNKTIDANGTGNSITNLEVADLASGVLDTDISAVAGTDTTLASAKAIKTYVDTQIATKDNSDEITEGSTNLYFTNARADARITAADTDSLSEGSTNLYFTNARADARITAADTDSLSEGSTNLYFTNARADARITNALVDENDMSSNSATKLPSQQSVKAYVDAEVAGVVDSAPSALNTLNELAAALGDDSNFATSTATSLGNRLRIDVNSQGLTGTQKTNAATNLGLNTVATSGAYSDLSGTPTIPSNNNQLSNGAGFITDSNITVVGDDSSGVTFSAKDNDNIKIAGGTNITTAVSGDTVTITGPDTSSFITASSTTALTNKTFDADGTGNALSNIDLANLKSGVLDTDISNVAGTDTTLASAKAIKTYVDAQVATKDNSDEITEGSTNLYFTNARADARIAANIIDEDAMGTDSETRAPSQQSVKAYIATQIATKDNSDEITEGSTNLYFTDARADARITAALIDEDDMATNSATRLPSQQSVKAYVDANGGGSAITVQDEGGALATAATTINFVGSGVVASGTGATKTITIAGGSASTGDITFSGNELSTGSSNADLELTANGTGGIMIQPRGGIADFQGNLFEGASTSLSRGAGLPNIFAVADSHTNGTRGYKYDSMYFKLTGSDTSSGNARYRHTNNLTVDYNGLDSTNSGSSRGARMTRDISTTNSSAHAVTVGNHGGFAIWSQVGDDEGGNSKGDVAATNVVGLTVSTALVTASGQTVSATNLKGITNGIQAYGDGTETIANVTAYEQQIYNQTVTGNAICANLIYNNGTVGGDFTGLRIDSQGTGANTTGTAFDVHLISDDAQSNLNNLIIGDDGNGSDKIIKTANSGDNIKIQTQGAGDVIIEPGQDQSDSSGNDTASTVFADRFRHREAFYDDGSHNGTHTPDINNGNVQTIELDGDITINSISNIARGHSITLILVQDSTGGRSLTSTMKFAGGVKTLSPAGGAIDVLSIFYTGSTYLASLSNNFS